MAIHKRTINGHQYYYYNIGIKAKDQMCLGREGAPNRENIRRAREILHARRQKILEQEETLDRLLKSDNRAIRAEQEHPLT